MKEYSSSVIKTKSGPKLFAWIASAVLIALIITSQLLPRGHHPNLRILGVGILLISPIFIFLPFFLLSKYGKKKVRKNYMQTCEVVDHSLYAVVRHPQYLGYVLLTLGFSFLSQNIFILFLAATTIISFYLQTLREERFCIDQFGEPYKNYLNRVPRFNILLGVLKVIRGNQND